MSTDKPSVAPSTASRPARGIDVILVGAGARARAWSAPLSRSPLLRLVGLVSRTSSAEGGPDVLAGIPRCASLAEALSRFPEALPAVALPPRSGLAAVRTIVAAGRRAVVEAPLHDALIDEELPAAAAGVQVAHGWVTLPGRRWLQTVMATMPPRGHMRLSVRGLPEEADGDPREALIHALALARRLCPGAEIVSAVQPDGSLIEVALARPDGEGCSIALSVLAHGRRIEATVEAGAQRASWRWEGDRESLSVTVPGKAPLARTHMAPPAEVRALAQLLGGDSAGDDLRDAAAVLRLARDAERGLPSRLPIGRRAMRSAAAITARQPDHLLARLGLSGALPVDEADDTSRRTAVSRLHLGLPDEPFELWPFRAGIKPVVFLTLRPEDVESTLAHFGGAPYERRDRLVHIDAQDRWTDRRDIGEPRAELYISRDAALAKRAAHLQTEADPTRSVMELGGLVGYPRCCVEAFSKQDDRSNNSRNRYYSQSRTSRARDVEGAGSNAWPWPLNNLHTVIIPFYPCSYRCVHALAWARASFDELAKVHPAMAAELRAGLSLPVLYFDHDHQLVLDGAGDARAVRYRRVLLPSAANAAMQPLATALSLGDELRFDDDRLSVYSGGAARLTLERTDPGQGFLAPYGDA